MGILKKLDDAIARGKGNRSTAKEAADIPVGSTVYLVNPMALPGGGEADFYTEVTTTKYGPGNARSLMHMNKDVRTERPTDVLSAEEYGSVAWKGKRF